MELKELVEQLNTANTQVKNMREKMEAEAKANGEAQAETKEALEAAEKKFGEYKEMFENIDKELKELKSKRPGHGMGERKTIGQMYIESDVYEQVKSNGRGNGTPVSIQRKDITGTTGSAVALQDTYRDPEVYRSIGGRRQLRVRDLLPVVPTTDGVVEIMRQNSFTNNAGPQQPSTPNTARGAGELEAKAQSNITWELVTVPVRTIAHWLPASRQALSDAPMLRSLIDDELTYGLQLESDDQILNGDGTNQNLTGILNDAAINDVGELPSGTAADDVPAAMIDHIRSAITQCQLSEYYDIDGIVLNPQDWEKLETAKATDGHFLLIAFAATSNGTDNVWRVPVVITNAMPVNTFLLGSWRMGAKLYEREGIEVRVSESHADYFVKNGVAILGEERYALGINRPKAFTKGAFTVAI